MDMLWKICFTRNSFCDMVVVNGTNSDNIFFGRFIGNINSLKVIRRWLKVAELDKTGVISYERVLHICSYDLAVKTSALDGCRICWLLIETHSITIIEAMFEPFQQWYQRFFITISNYEWKFPPHIENKMPSKQ